VRQRRLLYSDGKVEGEQQVRDAQQIDRAERSEEPVAI